MKHDLKTWPFFYQRVFFGEKNFEIRKNDRDFLPGDILNLQEWDKDKGYTGRSVFRKIGYILHEHEGLKEGFVIMELLAP